MIYNESSWEGLIPFVEERLRMSRQNYSSFAPIPEMIGVFGMYSDNVIREVINHVRTPCIYIGHVEYFINDIYSHIASAFYNHYRNNGFHFGRADTLDVRRNFLEKVGMVNRISIMGDSGDPRDLLQASTDRQRIDEYIREGINIYKNLLNMPEETKFLIWLDWGSEPIGYNTLKKIYNIQSPHLVVIISSLRNISNNIEFISRECGGSGRMLLNKVVPYLFEYNDPVSAETANTRRDENNCNLGDRPGINHRNVRDNVGYNAIPRNDNTSDIHENTFRQESSDISSKNDTDSEDVGIPRNIIRRRKI